MPVPVASFDAVLPRLRRAATALRRRDHDDLAALADACGASVMAAGDPWVAASVEAKGWGEVPTAAAEEWGSGPLPVARLLRLCAQFHAARARGAPFPPHAARPGPNGTRVFEALPADGLGDRLLLRGYRAQLVVTGETAATRPEPRGDVALVLGAGNVTATPLLDTIDQVLLRGRAVLLKLSPLHTALEPVFAHALAPLLAADLVHLVTGDAGLGALLAVHPDVAAVHLTGSVATAAALRAEPRLAGKELTTELGCCTPALVVPGAWRTHELQHVAAQLATFVAWNGGATCVAPRVVVTARGWPQREPFLHALRTALAAQPARVPFHPAARTDFAAATQHEPHGERLPPTLRHDLDPERDAARFAAEHFAPVLLEVALPGDTTTGWLDAATAFVRERVFGALSAYVWAPPRVRTAERRTIDAAVRRLPHGTVAINTWTGLGYGLGTPWGVRASAPWRCGTGWSRDLWGHRGLQQVVLEAPFRSWPPPPWSSGRRGAAATLRALVHHYTSPSLRQLAAIACHACR